jgi:8-oxo-dGTP pyrophosphatase MutT (NUDIX family)
VTGAAAAERFGRAVAARRVAAFPRQAVDRPDLRPAGVAVCVTEDDGRWCLLVTRRAAGLRAHAGQWALPGGRLEPGESAVDGALRELREEVGLVLGPDAVLGLLDDYVTRSGYVMTPVVCWAGATGELTAAEAEVAAIHHVPLDDLDVPPRFDRIPESDAPVIRLPLLGGFVHAPTAAVVHQFCQVACHGLSTRVAHLEQPVFAWR